MGAHPIRPAVGRDRGRHLRSVLAGEGSLCTTRRRSHAWSSWNLLGGCRERFPWPRAYADAATSRSVGPETDRHLRPGPPPYLRGRAPDRVRVVVRDESLGADPQRDRADPLQPESETRGGVVGRVLPRVSELCAPGSPSLRPEPTVTVRSAAWNEAAAPTET